MCRYANHETTVSVIAKYFPYISFFMLCEEKHVSLVFQFYFIIS